MEVKLKQNKGMVQGFFDPSFQALANTFIQNFESRNELGASLCITIAGETKVDLWGGFTHPRRPESTPLAWHEDTLSVVFSCTKAATALCAHLLIDQGKLNLHAKVAHYWPEFGCNGKENITVEMLLNHSAGLPALRDPVKRNGYHDWQYMAERIADETPFWSPGTRNGYHMTTYGWTVGELVRRISGVSLGTFFRINIAEPLGLDFWIGLPESEHHRVAPMQQWTPKKNEGLSPFTHKLLTDKHSLQYLALFNSGRHKTDKPESYLAEYGAGGGITNARHLAGMYSPLANKGEYTGGRLISANQIAKMSAVSVATLEDATLLMPTRFGLGYMLSMDNRHRENGHLESSIIGKDAFGHAGAGGSIGFADPACKLAFGYTMNRMGSGVLLNERGQSLVDSLYQCLGYQSNISGAWER